MQLLRSEDRDSRQLVTLIFFAAEFQFVEIVEVVDICRHRVVIPIFATIEPQRIDDSTAFGGRIMRSSHEMWFVTVAKSKLLMAITWVHIAKYLAGQLIVGMRGNSQSRSVLDCVFNEFAYKRRWLQY